MIICNEGLPRAGKSYDTMLTHVLPALAAGRHVYARVNGLDHAEIARHLKLPEDRIRELLIPVAPEEVHALFVAIGDNPPQFRVQPNSLVVIDEVHNYYVSSRQPLPTERENFFGMHGHIGLDIVLMTQALKRLHSAIFLRIQRKNVFTKLSALGKENTYVIRFYNCAGIPGQFEKLTTETHTYDPAIFPLYLGFQPEATNTGVYKAGSKTVWQAIKKPAIAMALCLAVGVFALWKFFSGSGPVAEKKPAAPVAAAVIAPAAPVAKAVEARPTKQEIDDKELATFPPAIRQILQMGSSTRPRLAGTIGARHVLEWRSPQGQARERLTSDQLESMGWMITKEPYGVVATYADRTIIFTAWPMDLPNTQSSALTQNIRLAGGTPLVPAQAANGTQPGQSSGGIISGAQQAGYGGLGYGAPSASEDDKDDDKGA